MSVRTAAAALSGEKVVVPAGHVAGWEAVAGENDDAQRGAVRTGETKGAGVALFMLAAKRKPPRSMGMDRVLAKGLQDKFQTVQRHSTTGDQLNFNAKHWEICVLARSLSMNVSDVAMIKETFDMFDYDGSGRLEMNEFEAVVTQILEHQLNDPALAAERAKAASEWHWWDSDVDQSGCLDFKQFVKWYTSNGFKEDMLLSPEERWLRSLAKKYDLHTTFVDEIKKSFDTFDKDGNGSVDMIEFEQILNKVLKIPLDLRLPPSRITYFWSEIDTNMDGAADFEEFLVWWLKYFRAQPGDDSRQMNSVFEFYKNIRRIDPRHLDPPAVPGAPAVAAKPAEKKPPRTIRSKSLQQLIDGQSSSSGGGSGSSDEEESDEERRASAGSRASGPT